MPRSAPELRSASNAHRYTNLSERNDAMTCSRRLREPITTLDGLIFDGR